MRPSPRTLYTTDTACTALLDANCEVVFENNALGFTVGKALDAAATSASLAS